MNLTTERLLLRPFRADDDEALHAYLSHPDAVRYEPYGPHTRQESARAAADRAHDERLVAVCLADGTLVGNLYVAPEGPPQWRTWTVGYVMNPGHWGHGYATEAVRALLTELFVVRGAHRVVARCDPRNTASWRLLERAGMRREAHVLQGASFTTAPDGTPVWHDTYQYAVLASEWGGEALAPGRMDG